VRSGLTVAGSGTQQAAARGGNTSNSSPNHSCKFSSMYSIQYTRALQRGRASDPWSNPQILVAHWTCTSASQASGHTHSVLDPVLALHHQPRSDHGYPKTAHTRIPLLPGLHSMLVCGTSGAGHQHKLHCSLETHAMKSRPRWSWSVTYPS
jgi:hypothetical protein